MSQQVWIYHELQDSLLCGQHALNNLIQQQNFFHAAHLADIAHQLDAEERLFMDGNLREPSGNVDAQGNFSIQVITNALSNIGVELAVWNMERSGGSDPSTEVGFIVNRDAHWFSVRNINGKWWDLNSAKETPELISAFYLGAFLTQLAHDGYSVFVARGSFPDLTTNPPEKGPFWHLESALTKNNPNVAKEKFTGQGNKLGGIGTESSGNEEEDDLARAIALSVADMNKEAQQSSSSTSPEISEKERIRAKRLAAMGL